jgi:hypothetical protein
LLGHFFLDPTRKTDPVTGLAHSRRTYERLLRDVVKEYNECIGVTELVPLNVVEHEGTVTTSVKLNVRAKPSTKASIVQVLPAHTQLQYKAVLHNGEAVNNNPVWYVDTNGNFLWSGGLVSDNIIVNTTPIARAALNTIPIAAEAVLQPDPKCIDFIKSKEGLRLQAYQDSAGIWTIGYGTIKYDNNSAPSIIRVPVKFILNS